MVFSSQGSTYTILSNLIEREIYRNEQISEVPYSFLDVAKSKLFLCGVCDNFFSNECVMSCKKSSYAAPILPLGLPFDADLGFNVSRRMSHTRYWFDTSCIYFSWAI